MERAQFSHPQPLKEAMSNQTIQFIIDTIQGLVLFYFLIRVRRLELVEGSEQCVVPQAAQRVKDQDSAESEAGRIALVPPVQAEDILEPWIAAQRAAIAVIRRNASINLSNGATDIAELENQAAESRQDMLGNLEWFLSESRKANATEPLEHD